MSSAVAQGERPKMRHRTWSWHVRVHALRPDLAVLLRAHTPANSPARRATRDDTGWAALFELGLATNNA